MTPMRTVGLELRTKKKIGAEAREFASGLGHKEHHE